MKSPVSNNVGNLHAAQSAFPLPHAKDNQSPQVSLPGSHDPQHVSTPQAQSGVGSTQDASQDDAAIEQRWIQKAKQIISQTQDDPFNQARLLIELKNQYLAARYGKHPEDPNYKP